MNIMLRKRKKRQRNEQKRKREEKHEALNRSAEKLRMAGQHGNTSGIDS